MSDWSAAWDGVFAFAASFRRPGRNQKIPQEWGNLRVSREDLRRRGWPPRGWRAVNVLGDWRIPPTAKSREDVIDVLLSWWHP